MSTATEPEEAPPGATTLLRLTLVSDERRADLAVPGRVPLVELLPDMLRTLGVLDATVVHAGYDLAAPDGRRLSPEAPLAGQGIRDGDTLTVVIGAEQRPPRVYDDVIEAMSDAVEDQMSPWRPEASRRTALGAAAVLLLVGAGTLALLRPSPVAGAVAGVIGLLLVVGAIVLSRVQEEQDAALVLGWVGAAFAGVSGHLLVPSGAVDGWPAVAAAGGVALAGAAAAIGAPQRRAALAPLVLVGAVVGGAAAVATVTSFSTGQVAAVTLVLVVLAAVGLPRLVLETSGTRVPQAYTHDDLVAEPDPVEPEVVSARARRSHELMLAASVTVGILLVVLAPYVVGLGVTGAVLVLCGVGVTMLRTRQYRVDSEVGAALGLGVVALATTAVAAVVQHPGWRPALGLVGALVGAALLIFTLLPLQDSVRRGRITELVELGALVAMLPLVVVAIGLVGVV